MVTQREWKRYVGALRNLQYPKPDSIHWIERLHTPQPLRLEDLTLSDPIGLTPGVVLEAKRCK